MNCDIKLFVQMCKKLYKSLPKLIPNNFKFVEKITISSFISNSEQD